jgi:uncharacterized membrane protein YbaN (DUF454 family)
MNRLAQILLITIGTISVALGIMGIFLPLLPTTPFLLLAASCYIKASETMYNYLINNRFLGEYIKNYREKKGITIKSKIIAISMLWSTIVFTIFLLQSSLYIRMLLIFIATAVTWHIASQKTLEQAIEVEVPATEEIMELEYINSTEEENI